MDWTDLAKASDGMSVICKRIIDGHECSEHDFSAALMEHSKSHRQTGESAITAFGRLLEKDDDIKAAYGVVKNYPNMMSVEVVSPEVGSSSVSDDAGKAYDQLQAKIAEQRKLAPTLTISQLVDRVYGDNPELVKGSWHSAATPT
jgi:hypothetical protein